MENLISEQIEAINGIFETIGGYGLSDEEMKDFETIEDKIEGIWNYYECAGFAIETRQDLFKLLNI